MTLERRPTGDYEPLAERSVQGLVTMLGKKAGIAKHVHPHLFRHSLALDSALRLDECIVERPHDHPSVGGRRRALARVE